MIKNGLCSHKLYSLSLLEMKFTSCAQNYTDFINNEYVFFKLHAYEHTDHIFNAHLKIKNY